MSSIDRKATFTLDELDLRRAVRLHAFSGIREKQTIIRLALLWFIAMAAFVGFFSAAGMPWPELRGNLLPSALIITATILVFSLGIPLALALKPRVLRTQALDLFRLALGCLQQRRRLGLGHRIFFGKFC